MDCQPAIATSRFLIYNAIIDGTVGCSTSRSFRSTTLCMCGNGAARMQAAQEPPCRDKHLQRVNKGTATREKFAECRMVQTDATFVQTAFKRCAGDWEMSARSTQDACR